MCVINYVLVYIYMWISASRNRYRYNRYRYTILVPRNRYEKVLETLMRDMIHLLYKFLAYVCGYAYIDEYISISGKSYSV